MAETMKSVVFSDLDDTLLDRQTFEFAAARPGLELLKINEIPLVLMTSKTAEETFDFIDRLEIEEAFSVENGGAVFIPARYVAGGEEESLVRTGGFCQKALGTPFAELEAFFRSFVDKHGAPFTALTDLSVDEVVRTIRLPAETARKALARAYDLPFSAGPGAEGHLQRLADEASLHGLSVVEGGRFHHLKGKADKGTAFDVLRPYYLRSYGPLRTVGLGDSENDAPFLAKVDIPVIVRRSDGRLDPRLAAALPEAARTEAAGPAGWAEAVAAVIRERS